MCLHPYREPLDKLWLPISVTDKNACFILPFENISWAVFTIFTSRQFGLLYVACEMLFQTWLTKMNPSKILHVRIQYFVGIFSPKISQLGECPRRVGCVWLSYSKAYFGDPFRPSYINLRSRPSVPSCVHVEFGFIQFALGIFYADCPHLIMKVYMEHATWISTIPLKISHLFTFPVSNRWSQRDSRVYAWIVVTT